MNRTAVGYVVAFCCACFPVFLTGCGTNAIGKTDLERGIYSRDDVDQFSRDTRSLPQRIKVPEYVIGIADVIDVVFLFHKDLTTLAIPVRRDGKISLPYIGDQVAAGFTPMKLDSVLTGRFVEILKDPSISVIVRKMARQKVYVLGQVKRPGVYLFDDELSVVQSLAMAGGLKKEASGGHVVLIRREGLDRIVGVEVNAKAVMTAARMQDDIRLRNFDIVYVPKKPLYSVTEFMTAVDHIISPPIDAAFTVWNIRNISASFDYFKTNSSR